MTVQAVRHIVDAELLRIAETTDRNRWIVTALLIAVTGLHLWRTIAKIGIDFVFSVALTWALGAVTVLVYQRFQRRKLLNKILQELYGIDR